MDSIIYFQKAQTEQAMLFDLSVPEVNVERIRMGIQDLSIKESDKEQMASPNIPIQGANAQQRLQHHVFPKKDWLKRHMMNHAHEKQHGYSEYNKTFSQSSERHLINRIDGMPQAYLLTNIGKEETQLLIQGSNTEQKLRNPAFSKEKWLERHKKTHVGKKPYDCSECRKSFPYPSNLRKHMKIHTNEKPYSCPKCIKNFSRSSHLKRHMRIHTGEKPHNCSECGKRFSDSSTMRDHMRIHTGEKPYNCSECGKRFSDRSTFKRHTRIHSGEKLYSCSVCEKRFYRSGDLNKHIKAHHKKSSTPNWIACIQSNSL